MAPKAMALLPSGAAATALAGATQLAATRRHWARCFRLLRGSVCRPLPSLVALVCLALGAAGCAREPHPSLGQLESFAFVPRGQADRSFGMGSGLPLTVGASRDLFVDLFEVSRDEFERWMGTQPLPRGLAAQGAQVDGSHGAWPAYCDFFEARELARRRGMRLLTVGEWLYVAGGPVAQRYPWGRVFQSSLANTLELGLLRPVPVGTFENGRSPFGCYDMLGNVAEWVEGRAPNALESPVRAENATLCTVMGGSFLSRVRPLYELDREIGVTYPAESLPPGTRSIALGVRCAVDAREFLREHAGTWAGQRQRVRLVGERLGPAAVPMLEELRGEAGSPTALRWLLEGARR